MTTHCSKVKKHQFIVKFEGRNGKSTVLEKLGHLKNRTSFSYRQRRVVITEQNLKTPWSHLAQITGTLIEKNALWELLTSILEGAAKNTSLLKK